MPRKLRTKNSHRVRAYLLFAIALMMPIAPIAFGQDFAGIGREEAALRQKFVAPVAVVGRVGLKHTEHPNGTKLSDTTLTLDADLIYFCAETYGQIRVDGSLPDKAIAGAWRRVPKATEIFLWGPGQSKKLHPAYIGKRVLVIGLPLSGMTGWYILPVGVHAASIEVLP